MTFASLINIVTIVLCGAVLVQCVRVTRALAAFRQANLPAMVHSLEAATGQAETVLGQMRDVLRHEAEPKMQLLSQGNAVAEELGVMIGIANATADRLLESARDSRSAVHEQQGLAA